MATSIDQSNFIKTALRLPPELHAAVHEAAKSSGRSYNAEVVNLIEKGLTAPSAFIHAPARVRSVDEQGNVADLDPKQLFGELEDHLRRAFHLAALFKAYEDGEPEPADIRFPPDWPDAEATQAGAKKSAPRSRKISK